MCRYAKAQDTDRTWSVTEEKIHTFAGPLGKGVEHMLWQCGEGSSHNINLYDILSHLKFFNGLSLYL